MGMKSMSWNCACIRPLLANLVTYMFHLYILNLCFAVTVTMPPENTTVKRGSSVTISCGYQSASVLFFTWIINGTSFSPQEIVDSPLYQLNNPTSPNSLSLFQLVWTFCILIPYILDLYHDLSHGHPCMESAYSRLDCNKIPLLLTLHMPVVNW